MGWGACTTEYGITFVKNDCKDLPSGASDHVWHHPSVVHTYFPLIMQCRASTVPRERSVRYPRHPGGSELHYKGEICVHYWRMVSNRVRYTRWKVITIIYDKRDPYTQWYTHAQPLWQIWVNKSHSAKYPIWVNTSNIEQGQVWSCCLFWVNDSYIRFGLSVCQTDGPNLHMSY